MGWIATGEANQVDDAPGVGGLAERDAGVVLVDLDPQIEGEEPKITHLEDDLHLGLDCLHLFFLGAGDHQVVDE